jgi:hypothetical protein
LPATVAIPLPYRNRTSFVPYPTVSDRIQPFLAVFKEMYIKIVYNRSDTIRNGWIRSDTVRYGEIWLDTVGYGWIRPDTVEYGTAAVRLRLSARIGRITVSFTVNSLHEQSPFLTFTSSITKKND